MEHRGWRIGKSFKLIYRIPNIAIRLLHRPMLDMKVTPIGYGVKEVSIWSPKPGAPYGRWANDQPIILGVSLTHDSLADHLALAVQCRGTVVIIDRKSTRLNSSHL